MQIIKMKICIMCALIAIFVNVSATFQPEHNFAPTYKFYDLRAAADSWEPSKIKQ